MILFYLFIDLIFAKFGTTAILKAADGKSSEHFSSAMGGIQWIPFHMCDSSVWNGWMKKSSDFCEHCRDIITFFSEKCQHPSSWLDWTSAAEESWSRIERKQVGFSRRDRWLSKKIKGGIVWRESAFRLTEKPQYLYISDLSSPPLPLPPHLPTVAGGRTPIIKLTGKQ